MQQSGKKQYRILSELAVVAQYRISHKPAKTILKQHAKSWLGTVAVGGFNGNFRERGCTVKGNRQAFALQHDAVSTEVKMSPVPG